MNLVGRNGSNRLDLSIANEVAFFCRDTRDHPHQQFVIWPGALRDALKVSFAGFILPEQPIDRSKFGDSLNWLAIALITPFIEQPIERCSTTALAVFAARHDVACS